MNIIEIADSLTPIGFLVCVVAVAWKWKQVNDNTKCIDKIDEKLDVITDKLMKIDKHMSATNGYLKGLENGKNKRR